MRQQAIEGNADAIASLLNRQLRPRGLKVTGQRAEDRLTLLLTGTTLPDPDLYGPYIMKALQRLRPAGITRIFLSGQCQGQPSPGWQQVCSIPNPQSPSSDLGHAPEPSPKPVATRPAGTVKVNVSSRDVWAPLWCEWAAVTLGPSLLYRLVSPRGGIHFLDFTWLIFTAAIVYLQTCVIARRLPNPERWLWTSAFTALLSLGFSVIPGIGRLSPGATLVDALGQWWLLRKTDPDAFLWLLIHCLVGWESLFRIRYDSFLSVATLLLYGGATAVLISRLLEPLPEQLPAPADNWTDYVRQFLQRPMLAWGSSLRWLILSADSGFFFWMEPLVWKALLEIIGDGIRCMRYLTPTALMRRLQIIWHTHNRWATLLLSATVCNLLALGFLLSFGDGFSGLKLLISFDIFMIYIPAITCVVIGLATHSPRPRRLQTPGLFLLVPSVLNLLLTAVPVTLFT